MFCRECNTFLAKTSMKEKEWTAPISEEVADKESFVKEIYSNVATVGNENHTYCQKCFTTNNFVKMMDFPFKPCFPPVGSSETGQVLFIGTNPRCKPATKDEEFYRYALASEENFVKFSIDGKYKSKRGYFRRLFADPHYSIHRECLYNVNRRWRLGEKSSVTEIFMCASESSGIFNYIEHLSDFTCAENYLIKYIELVKPKIIVSLGGLALKWFQNKFPLDVKENTQKLTDDKSSAYLGNPLTDTITNLHSCFTEINLKSNDSSYVVFSLHPGSYLSQIDKNKLLDTFNHLASLQGFDKENFS